MKSRIAQHLNEIVSITMMALMAVALIAGQATVTDAVDVNEDETGRIVYSIVLTISAD